MRVERDGLEGGESKMENATGGNGETIEFGGSVGGGTGNDAADTKCE